MTLHNNPHLYADIIDAASRPIGQGGIGIHTQFIEKDYWITRALKLMSEADTTQKATFKGGTSLTKCYSIGNRFSEDIDIAISEAWTLSGNQLKTLIKKTSKAMSSGLTEIPKATTRKGSHYHKAYYAYSDIVSVQSDIAINSGELLIEINSFANPYPRERRLVSSFVYEFLKANEASDIINEYGLEPFEVYALDKRRTFTEKIVSLFRASLGDDHLTNLKAKIRHFYDLYYLWKDKDCREYIHGNQFAPEFNELMEQDRVRFKEPVGWQSRHLSESPLVKDFGAIWEILSAVYSQQLKELAYAEIPAPSSIADSFIEILQLFKSL